MIVTVTLNPALEVEYEAENVRAGETNLVRRVSYRAAGRGLAVARILQTFGHDVVAAGLAGGSAGELIRAELARAGVATQFTRIAAESRRVTVISEAGSTTSFAEPAPYITTEELGRLASDYRALLDGATAVVLCGSLPDSLPAETYASFVSYAGQAGVPVILDASGSALAYGAERRPTLAILAAPSGDEAPIAGPQSVALLGDRALQVLTPEGQWQVSVAATGRAADRRRDAVVAGFVPGIALSWAWPDMLRHAAALAAGWSQRGQLDIAEYERALNDASVLAVAPVR